MLSIPHILARRLWGSTCASGEGTMEKIKLYTRDGGYVVTVTVPVFNPKPEAIAWGSRVFVLKDTRYVEGLLWPIIEGQVPVEMDRAELTESLDAEMAAGAFKSPEEGGLPLQVEQSFGFDYGKQLPDGQFERHPTIPAEGIKPLRPLRHSHKHLKCGGITTMGHFIAQTYSIKPEFYTGTFCSRCAGYFTFGTLDGNFVWIDERTN